MLLDTASRFVLNYILYKNGESKEVVGKGGKSKEEKDLFCAKGQFKFPLTVTLLNFFFLRCSLNFD